MFTYLTSLFRFSALCTLLIMLSATVGIAQNVPAYVPTDGLVGWWPFNGNANDESGNGNDGVVTGATLTTDRNNTSSSAYSFDGVNDFIATTLDQKTAFTVSVWVYMDSYQPSEYQGIVQHKKNCERGGGYMLATQNNKLRWIIFNCGECSLANCGTEIIDNNVTTLSTSAWFHLTLTSDGTNTQKLYLNGTLLKTITNANAIVDYGVQPFSLGKHHDGSAEYYFAGKIDDVGYWDRALTAQEVTTLYNSCDVTISTSPANQTISGGHQTALTVTASSTSAISYQWQRKDGASFVNLSDGTDFSGSTSATLTIKSARVSQKGPYRCAVSAGSCAVNSNEATLTVECPCNN